MPLEGVLDPSTVLMIQEDAQTEEAQHLEGFWAEGVAAIQIV